MNTKAPKTEEVVVAPKKKNENVRQFTYIGAGEGSPQVINFMGKQKFIRGKLTEVTDPEILSKLPGVSTFVEGESDPEKIHQIDADAKEAADLVRKSDALLNAKFSKKFRTE